MPSDQSTPPLPADNPGLPPVEPPSGRMFLQLFLRPAIIVVVLVGLFLIGPAIYRALGRMLGWAEFRSAEQFLRDLDSNNKDIRWRAAADLSQVLPRNPDLAADADFAFQLTRRLERTVKENAATEKELAGAWSGLSDKEQKREEAKVNPDRDLCSYLMACVGKCIVPAGVEPLKRLALQDKGMEPDALRLRRGLAVWALANLGDTLARFDGLDEEKQQSILDQLKDLEAVETFATSAKELRAYLRARQKNKQTTLGVVDVLEKCAEDRDPYIRKLTALAACFWYGTDKENKRLDEMLVKLTRDSGVGEKEMENRAARNPAAKGSRQLVKRRGFQVQPNAVLSLVRRGSARANEHLAVVELLLSPERLRTIFVTRPDGGDEEPDESAVIQTTLDALKALALAKKKNARIKFDKLLPPIDELKEDDNKVLRAQAVETYRLLTAAE